MSKLVLGKPLDELIAVQAMNFNRDWKNFLELITADEKRKALSDEYRKLMEEGKVITVRFNEHSLSGNNVFVSDN